MNFIFGGLIVSLVLLAAKLYGFEISWLIIPFPFLFCVFSLIVALLIMHLVTKDLFKK